MAWGERVEKTIPPEALQRLSADIKDLPRLSAIEVLTYANLRDVDITPLREALERYAHEKLRRFLQEDARGQNVAVLGCTVDTVAYPQAREHLKAVFAQVKPSMAGVYERGTIEQDMRDIDQCIDRKISVLAFSVHGWLGSGRTPTP